MKANNWKHTLYLDVERWSVSREEVEEREEEMERGSASMEELAATWDFDADYGDDDDDDDDDDECDDDYG